MSAPPMPNLTLAEANRTRRAIIFAAVAASVALLFVASLFYLNSRLSRVERATVDSPCVTMPHSMACHQVVHHQIQSLTPGQSCLIIRRAAPPDSRDALYRECFTHRHRETPKTRGSSSSSAPAPADAGRSGLGSAPTTTAIPTGTTASPSSGPPTGGAVAPSPSPPGSEGTGGGPPPAPSPSPAPNPQPSPRPPPKPGGGAGLPLPGRVCDLAPRLC